MIRVEDLRVAFGDVTVLEGVSLSVDRGEVVGLVGPNGAGKTTLLRAVNGALDPDGGRVTVDGDAVAELSSRAVSRRVGTVPQDTSVRFGFTVEQVVAMGRTPYRSRFSRDADATDHVERALERTGTARLRDRRVDTLSGGERQRVFVARALAQDAPALVLDEPTASLDVNHAVETLALIRDLADDGRGALAAIHDLDAAARFCDRLLLLADSGVVERGPPETVLRADALAETFDVATAVTRNPVTGSPSVTALPANPASGTRVHVLGWGPPAAQAVGQSVAAGHEVTVGPVPAGGGTAAVAESLDVPAVTAGPFASLSAAVRGTVRERVGRAAVTVLAVPTETVPRPIADLARGTERLLLVAEDGQETDTGPLDAAPATSCAPGSVAEHVAELADGRAIPADDWGTYTYIR